MYIVSLASLWRWLLFTTMDSQPLIEPKHRRKSKSRLAYRWKILGAAILFLSVSAGLTLGFGIAYGVTTSSTSSSSYKHAAVATDAPKCSEVGVDILKMGGSAVDAAITSLLCVGTINLQSTGIGGGGFMVYYNSSSKQGYTFDYRETAPGKATTELYNNTPASTTLIGGLALAVPGELRGLEMAWKSHGVLPWSELFKPVIQIAEEGFSVSKTLAEAIKDTEEYLLSGNFSGLQELLAPNGTILKEGDILKRPLYADTLRKVAQYGADYFYQNLTFTSAMVLELQEEYQSIVTVEDFANYSVNTGEPVLSNFSGRLTVLGVPPPSSGAVLALTLNILDGYQFTSDDLDALAYHRIVESFKFSYGQRLRLGDPGFNETVRNEVIPFMESEETAADMKNRISDDSTHNTSYYLYPLLYSPPSPYGTSHLSVLAENGDAVAATSTINTYFGCKIRSKLNGVIFNSEMDDFSVPTRNNTYDLPPSRSNYIEPGKRPQSSTTPTIIVDPSGRVKMVVGASGGSKITTAVAQVILDVLNFGKPLSAAISYPRLHHQLFPDHVTVEKAFPKVYVEGLEERGHKVVKSSGYAVVQGIHVDDGRIYATSDPRKGGKPAGY